MNAYLKKMGRPTEAQLIEQRDELLKALIDLYAVAAVDDDKYWAVTQAAAIIEKATASTEHRGAGA